MGIIFSVLFFKFLEFLKRKNYINDADMHSIDDSCRWKSKMGIFNVHVHDS